MTNEQQNPHESQKGKSNSQKRDSDGEMEEDDVPDIYTFLDIPRDASQHTIKKKYHAACLKFHPDKLSHLPLEQLKQSTIKFTQMLDYYKILLDQTTREHYNRTGRLDVSDDLLPENPDWSTYYKELWDGVVSGSTIDAFTSAYQNTEQEKEDVLKTYTEMKGDMESVMENVMCCGYKDEPRFIEMIKNAIKDGKVKEYKGFAKSTTKKAIKERLQRAMDEEKEAQELKDEINKNKTQKNEQDTENRDNLSTTSLQQILKKRNAQRMDSIADSIEKKYKKQSTSSKGKSKAEKFEEPSDAVFAEIQAKLMKNRN